MYRNYEDDDDDDGEYGIIGTPFAPLEPDKIVSRKPEIDQTVRDERGRRRFHGAFTGGFSAGYWNTVGSAEGFTPKIFLSTRKEKLDKSSLQSKPEDYMDDEDFGSFGIAPKRIHTKDDFVENLPFAGLRNVDLTFEEVIKSVFEPTKMSIGKRLFLKMKRHSKQEKLNWNNISMLEDETPNDDKKSKLYEPKNNFHGLGYNSMLKPQSFVISNSLQITDGKKNDYVTANFSGKRLKISGEAFGYGALEDDDHMDVYSKDDMSQYDFAIGSSLKPEKNKTRKMITSGGDSIQLEGFTQTNSNISLFSNLKNKYRPSLVPKGWKPKKLVKHAKKSRWNTTTNLTVATEENKPQKSQPTLNANLRAVILGEEVVYKMGIAKSKDDNLRKPSNELAFERDIKVETNKELNKIESKVPLVQKPLSGYFASKFTHSSSTTSVEDETISAGLSSFKDVSSLSSFQSQRANDSEKECENKKPKRTTYEWHPHSLLCKRFGIQNPYPQYPDIVGIVSIDGNKNSRNMTARLNNLKSSNNVKKALYSNLFQDLNNSNVPTKTITSTDGSKDHKNQTKIETTITQLNDPVITENVRKTKEFNENETTSTSEEPKRPPIDLFKSIFASDEEDDDDDDDGQDQDEGNKEVIEQSKNDQQTDSNENSRTTEPNTDSISNTNKNSLLNPATGVFHGIDFDDLNENFNPCLRSMEEKKKKKMENISETKNESNKSDKNGISTNVIEVEDNDDECYGPALPPPPSLASSSANLNSIPMNYTGTKHKEKKNKKKSKKKHKIHKKKSKKHHRSSSSGGGGGATYKKRSSKRSKTVYDDNNQSSSSSSTSSSGDDSDNSQSSLSTGGDRERYRSNRKSKDSSGLESKLLELIKKARHN